MRLPCLVIDADATLLIISHDRQFIERVATRWWWIDDGQLHELNELDAFYATLERDVMKSSHADASIVPRESAGWKSTVNGGILNEKTPHLHY